MGNNSYSSSSSKGMMYDHSRDKFEPDCYSNNMFEPDPFSLETRQKRLAGALIVGAVKGVANIGVTAISAIADHRTYYQCPRCKREVYAYGSFADNICLDCPGTVISSVGSTLSMASGSDAPQKVANSFASEATQVVTGIGGIIGNVATLQLNDDGNGTAAAWNGEVIFELSKGVSSDESSSYRSESIQSVTSMSCGIGAAVLDGSGIDHWWMNIETSMSYYQIQFTKQDSLIQVRRCDSVSHCNQNGLAEANRDENVSSSIESSYSKSNISKRTLGDLLSWLESGGMSSDYSLFNNNCQDLCKRIYGWI